MLSFGDCFRVMLFCLTIPALVVFLAVTWEVFASKKAARRTREREEK